MNERKCRHIVVGKIHAKSLLALGPSSSSPFPFLFSTIHLPFLLPFPFPLLNYTSPLPPPLSLYLLYFSSSSYPYFHFLRYCTSPFSSFSPLLLLFIHPFLPFPLSPLLYCSCTSPRLSVPINTPPPSSHLPLYCTSNLAKSPGL